MKELNKKQEKFLLLIGKNTGKCIRAIGRSENIYQTDVSCYQTRNLLLSLNLIKITKKKNKEIPSLTLRGEKLVKKIISKMML